MGVGSRPNAEPGKSGSLHDGRGQAISKESQGHCLNLYRFKRRGGDDQ